MKLHFISLGCSKNTVDTEQIIGLLMDELQNIELVSTPKEADYVFINTCGFLQASRDEAFSILKELKKSNIILLGCLTPFLSKDIFKKYPAVKAVMRQGEYERIPAILKNLEKKKNVFRIQTPQSCFDTSVQSRYLSHQHYAYLKIAEGCNHTCSYCLIPAIRGAYRSKPLDVVLKEAEMLAKSGIKELILIAQDTPYYGIDLYKKTMLSSLLKKLCAIKGIEWIRLHYTYPDRVNEKLIQTMANNTKILPYLDMPFQHADPLILQNMKRPFDVEKWKKLIRKIRLVLPNVCLRTTFIVGFPGETKKQFVHLKNFIQEIQFDRIGVFAYSREKGTPAYDLSSQIAEKVKRERVEELMLLQQKISKEKNKEFIGKTLRVLIDGFDEKLRVYAGRTYRDSPEIDGNVFVEGKKLSSSKKLKVGDFCEVRIVKAGEYDLWGKVR